MRKRKILLCLHFKDKRKYKKKLIKVNKMSCSRGKEGMISIFVCGWRMGWGNYITSIIRLYMI